MNTKVFSVFYKGEEIQSNLMWYETLVHIDYHQINDYQIVMMDNSFKVENFINSLIGTSVDDLNDKLYEVGKPYWCGDENNQVYYILYFEGSKEYKIHFEYDETEKVTSVKF